MKKKSSKPKPAALVVRTNIKAGEDGGSGGPVPTTDVVSPYAVGGANHNLTFRKTKKSSKPKTAALVVRTNIKAGGTAFPISFPE